VRSSAVIAVLLVSRAVACGGGDPAFSSGDGAGAGDNAALDDPKLPECAAVATSDGPHAVTFVFTNQGERPLFVLSQCRLRYDLAACSDGFQTLLPLASDCSVDCASAAAEGSGCVACGACVYDGVEVTAAAPLESEWSGETFAFTTTANDCKCHQARAAPPGDYRLSVAVYGSAKDAQRGKALYVVRMPFTLPAWGARVEIPLDARSLAPAP
jgi:hypothetical protein